MDEFSAHLIVLSEWHLLEFHRRRFEYYTTLEAILSRPSVLPITILPFSDPDDPLGYNDTSITHDLITDVYILFSNNTRRAESSQYLRSLPIKTLSIDATFKFAKKASILIKTETGTDRITPMKGGVLNGINENNETVVWERSFSPYRAVFWLT